MRLATNMIGLDSVYGHYKMIDVLAESGFEGIDFNADKQEYYTDAHHKDFYMQWRKYAEDKGVYFTQAHAPFDTSFVDEEATKKRFDEITEAMKISSWMGAEMIVVHPCKHIPYHIKGNTEKMFEYNFDMYKRLIPYCEEYGIKVAIENTYEKFGPFYSHSCCTKAEELAKMIDALDNPCFTVCLDVGHANLLREKPSQMIRTLGSRIGCLHIHDNNGMTDQHTLPYHGTLDWDDVMEALADVDYKGDLSYEAGLFFLNSPLDIRVDALKYMSVVGHNLINKFEEFKIK